MNKNNILITGFRPFSKNRENPTEMAIKRLTKKEYKGLIFDVDYNSSINDLKEFLAKDKEIKFVLSLGLASNRDKITVEKFAYNEYNMATPDNSGYIPKSRLIIDNCEPRLQTNCDVEYISDYISIKISLCEESINPGRYLCNFIYFNDLVLFNGNALFVHFPSLSEDNTIKDYVNVIETIVERLCNCSK